MNINENKVRLSGVANLSQPFKRTNCFVDLSIKNATIKDDIDLRGNEDGTINQIFKLTITTETEINILADNDIIKAKKKGSQSQMLRSSLMELYDQQYSAQKEFEEFYKQEMSKFIESVKKRLL
jgi:hypothetical protein